MLDEVQDTLFKSAKDEESPLSKLLDAYDEYHDKEVVDGAALLQFA